MTESWKQGGCHCGAVRWEALTGPEVLAHACNCSICRSSGIVQVILPAAKFRLLDGEDKVTTYTFNTGVAQHKFCSVCGVKSFYIPRSNPDGVSININCMDLSQFEKVTVEEFDGQNWEQHAGALAELSKS